MSRVAAYELEANFLDLTLTWKFSTRLEEVASAGTYCRNNAVSVFVSKYVFVVRLY